MVTLRDKIQEVLNEEVDIIEEEPTDCITEVWHIIDFIDCEDYDDARGADGVFLDKLNQIGNKLY